MATRGARVLSGSVLAAGVLVIAGAAPAAADCKSDGTPLGDLTTGICKGLEDTRKGVEDITKRITDGGGQDGQSGDSGGSGGDAGSGSAKGGDSRGGSGGGDSGGRGSGGSGGRDSGTGGDRASSGSKRSGGPATVTTGTRLHPPRLLNDPDAPPNARRTAPSDVVVLPEAAGRQEPIPAPRNAPMSQAQSTAPDGPIGRPVVVALSLAGIALIGNIAVQIWLRRRTV